MNENEQPPVTDPRRRMRELMSIPERDRTDAEWDELNELEIRTAPGNREPSSSEWRSQPAPPRRFQGPKPAPRAIAAPRIMAPGDNNAPSSERKPRPEGRVLKRQHRRTRRVLDPTGNT